MLNLSELAFTVRTEALVDAANKVAALGKSVENLAGSFQKLEKASSDAEKTQSQNAKAAAQAAEAQAKANKALSEAESAALKTASERADAETKKAKALKATTQAVDESTESAKKSVSILERQQTILEFQANGYSKGQSSILAYAKAAGVASDEIQEIGRVLQAQRTLMGGDPFDKSLGSLRSLQNEFKSLKEVQRLYTAEIPLTRKQMENLALDKIRLIEAMKIEGKSMTDIKNAIRQLNVEYITTAGSINKMIQAENAIDAAHKDAAKAASYLEREMQRVNFALQEQNNELNKGTANALNRFEQNLKRSGLTLDQQKVKMDEYRKSLLALEKTKGGGNTDYISRALGPQITDIFVGLATGQSPLTVMLQQGGQLRDQFALAGVAAADMGNTMRTAARGMVTSVAAVAGAFKDLIIGAFIDTGKGITNLVMNVTGLNWLLNDSRRKLASMGEEGFSSIGKLNKAFEYLGIAVGISLAAGVTTLITLGVALKGVIIQSAELSRNLELTGASLGLTKGSATDLALSLSNVGQSTAKVVDVISALAKESGFTADEIKMVSSSAIDLERYGKVSIEETAKALSKLKDDPVKALIKLAEETGNVSVATIENVKQMQKQGDAAGATEAAMRAWAAATKQSASDIKSAMSPIEQVWDSLLVRINAVVGGIQNIVRGSSTAQKIAEKELQLNDLQNGFFTKTFGLSPKARNQIPALQEELALLRAQAQAENEKAKARQTQSEEAKNYRIVSDVMKGVNGVLDKQIEKTLSLTEYTKKYREEKTKEGKFSRDEIANIEKAAKVEWEALQKKPKADPQEKYFESLMRSLTNETIKATTEQDKLTKAYTKMLELAADPRFQKLSEQEKAKAFDLLNQAHNAELATAATERQAAAEELRNKVLGKAEGLGKEYYDTLAKIQQYNKEGVYSDSEVIQLTEALYKATPAYKANIKAVEELNGLLLKYKEAAMASSQSIEQDNAALDLRMQVLGQTESQQVAITREYDRQAKLSKVNLDLELKRLQIAKDFADNPVKRWELEEQAEREAAEKRKVINREVAVAYAEDMQREFDRIRNGIADSIVTALFEGGKAGSKKLRDLIISELKKPVTLVVQAVVNTVLGNVVGSLLGAIGIGSGAGGGGGLGGLVSTGMQGIGLYNGLTSGSGFLGQVGSFLGLTPSVGVGAGAGATAVNGLSALTPVSIGTNSAAVTGVTAGSSSTGVLGSLSAAAPYILAIVALAASWKKLFGRTLKDSGIQGKFGGENGFEGSSYKYYKGGLFRSDKTELSPLEESFRKTLGDAFNAMKVQVTDFAKVLGLNADKLKDFTSEVKISLHGLSEQDAQAKIQEALATVNNEMAQEILGTWKETERQVTSTITGSAGRGADDSEASQRTVTETVKERTYVESEYAKEGEKAIDTLTRLATSLGTVNQVFDTLGYKAYEASLKGGDMASKLADLFGGLDKFIASTTFYYQNFYTEAERQKTAMRQLDKEFKAHNLTLPKTREEYRKLVESQDLTTEEGRKMYAWLIQLAPAFAEISKTAEDIAAAAEEARRNAVDAAYAALEAAVNAQKEILKVQEDATQAIVTRLQSIFDLLEKNVKELYMQVDSTAGMLADQGRAVIQQALSSGVLPDADVLGTAISAVRNSIDSTAYTAQFEQDKARLQFAADLKQLQDEAGEQLSVAELTLRAIKDQIEYLDKLLANAKAQIDVLNGINTGVLSIADALDKLYKAMFPPVPEPAGGGSSPFTSGPSGGGSTPSYDKSKDINSYLDSNYHGTSDLRDIAITASLKGWTQEDIARATGYNVADIEALFTNNGISKFATGGAFTNGVVQKPTRFNMGLMGESGSEAIMPLTNVGGKLGVSAVSTEDSTLADRVGNLEFALQAIAVNTGKMARILDGAQGEDGRSLMTSAAPV